MSLNSSPVTVCSALAGANSSTGVDLGGPGRYQLLLSGTFGGATAKLQVSHNGVGGTYADVAGVSLTAAGTVEFGAGAGTHHRVTTTGGTGSSINGTAAQLA